MTRARAKTDIQLAKDAHMNMLRIHAHVDHPAVYQEADEQGILLWQDFPLQWLYAKRILPEALRQSQEMVRLLHNHPSIVIWCLHNEPLHVDDTSVEPLLRQLTPTSEPAVQLEPRRHGHPDRRARPSTSTPAAP